MVKVFAPTPERPRASGFLLFIALALTLCFPYAEAVRNANELPRLVQGMALWDTGQWAVDGPARRRLSLGPDVARSPVDGRLYPNKPPGTSVLCTVAYGAARVVYGDALNLRTYTWWARLLTGALPVWLLAWFLVVRLTRAYGRQAAFAGTGLLVLGTPLLSYGHLAYGHALAACLLTMGVLGCVEAIQARGRWRAAAGYGALAGAAVGVEYGAVFGGLPLAVFIAGALLDGQRRGAAVAAVLGSLVPIAALALYHDAVFGEPWATGYHHVIDPGFADKHGQGLLGLTWPSWHGFWVHILSPKTGLLWWAPLFPAACYGLAVAGGHHDEPLRSQARVLLGIVVVYLVVVVSLSFEGGWRVGPRYMVVAFGGLAFGWAEFLSQIRGRAVWLGATVALAVVGFVVNALAANLWPAIDPTNVHHPFAEVLWPLWQAGVEPYGPLRSWWGVDALRLCVTASVVGGLMAMARVVEPMPSTIVAFVAGLVLGGTLLAAMVRWPAHPQGARNLAYIRRVYEPDTSKMGAPPSTVLAPLSPSLRDKARRGPVAPADPL